jgi:hypothetical protein
MDICDAPREAQEGAYRKGLIRTFRVKNRRKGTNENGMILFLPRGLTRE